MNNDFNALFNSLIKIQGRIDRELSLYSPMRDTFRLIQRRNELISGRNYGMTNILKLIRPVNPHWYNDLNNVLPLYQRSSLYSKQTMFLKVWSDSSWYGTLASANQIANFASSQSKIWNELIETRLFINVVDWSTKFNYFANSLSYLSRQVIASSISGKMSESDLAQVQEDTEILSEYTFGAFESGEFSLEQVDKFVEIARSLSKISLANIQGGILAILFIIYQFINYENKVGLFSVSTEHTVAIESLKKSLYEVSSRQIAIGDTIRIAVHDTKLYALPETSAPVILYLKEHQSVHISAIKHQWILIHFMTPERMPVSGWVLKKYFKAKSI